MCCSCHCFRWKCLTFLKSSVWLKVRLYVRKCQVENVGYYHHYSECILSKNKKPFLWLTGNMFVIFERSWQSVWVKIWEHNTFAFLPLLAILISFKNIISPSFPSRVSIYYSLVCRKSKPKLMWVLYFSNFYYCVQSENHNLDTFVLFTLVWRMLIAY